MITNQPETTTAETDTVVFPVSARLLPADLTEAGFDGDIGFSPAFDEREEGNGIGGLVMAFWLRGPAGAVKWEMHTGCFLPRTQSEWLVRFDGYAYKPTAGAVDWHSPAPLKENDVPRYDCRLLGPGNACYRDSGYLLGEEAYKALVTGGEAALWVFLRQMYRNQFSSDALAVEMETHAVEGEMNDA